MELNVYRVAPTIAALKTIYDSEHILRRHREVARTIAGFESFDDATAAESRKTLALRAVDASSVDELYTLAEQWLYDRQRVIPGERDEVESRSWLQFLVALKSEERRDHAELELRAQHPVEAVEHFEQQGATAQSVFVTGPFSAPADAPWRTAPMELPSRGRD
ncbi:hypothetical protein ACG02S_19790 [Roseateles sp. DC23W]|uniref:Uncharacterized protein n=1 Tax=Pelomonas dachongensis TaxID=3299029 RepID=A0ABW7ERJ9_9BURK